MSNETDDECPPRSPLADFINGGVTTIMRHVLEPADSDQEQALVFQCAITVLAHNIGMMHHALRLINKESSQLRRPLETLDADIKKEVERAMLEGIEHAKAHDDHDRTGSCKGCRH